MKRNFIKFNQHSIVTLQQWFPTVVSRLTRVPRRGAMGATCFAFQGRFGLFFIQGGCKTLRGAARQKKVEKHFARGLFGILILEIKRETRITKGFCFEKKQKLLINCLCKQITFLLVCPIFKISHLSLVPCVPEILDLTLVRGTRRLCLDHFQPFLKRVVFFQAIWAVWKIGLSLKSNLHFKLSLSKSLIHTVVVLHFLNWQLNPFANISFLPCQRFSARTFHSLFYVL